MFYVYCPYSIIFFVRIEKHACEQNCCKQHYLFLGILQEADGNDREGTQQVHGNAERC